MKLFETATCASLPLVDADLSQAITNAERSRSAHKALLRQTEALHLIELGGELIPSGPLASKMTVMAWNMQRCLYPEQSADLIRPHSPDVVLVSEMDNGMARTHQRNTTRALADSLGMRYAFGVEFFEMGLGNDIERRLSADQHNECGFHGNALLSRVEPKAVALIRLDDSGLWFAPQGHLSNNNVVSQPRIGGRCAIAAILETEHGDICVASVHLESLDDASIRLSQMERLIAALDAFAPDLPVIVGGDLNTGKSLEEAEERKEPLFEAAERHGFSWENNASGSTTRRSLLTNRPKPKLKLDWFFARGFTAGGADILPAVDEAGKVLSDHDLIMGHFEQTRDTR
ncbi:endonuclease/exonuclease/phosphatase family protein [uncultured Cohaesibacter sp.]|uniref:endonuclease/exonuclease/phosphatase family protein n=1 Tax=uncultured Cohaesibacter sp. TaxID=1002546 RepID=UPI00292F1F9E|nr:endonuclease/exonuclease/phosphatase family protein [uncultured Cohaesibacter sp.]